jgi:hypothetical protein
MWLRQASGAAARCRDRSRELRKLAMMTASDAMPAASSRFRTPSPSPRADPPGAGPTRWRGQHGAGRTALPRHQTLRATLDWSYELLPEPERVVFRRLAIFAGGFTLAAGRAVVTDTNTAGPDVVHHLANLVAKSLVVADIGGSLTRYRLLDTTRAYALEKLVQNGELDAIARRHAEFYRDLFERAETEWETRPTAEPITGGVSTTCARRSTGPFRRAAICRSAWL